MYSASAKTDFLIGDDGQRRGVIITGGAEVLAFSARSESIIEIPIFSSAWTLTLRAKLKCSAVSTGLTAGMYAYEDKKNHRFWIGESGTMGALFGFSEEIGLGIGHNVKEI